jgi:hypothetical protein
MALVLATTWALTAPITKAQDRLVREPRFEFVLTQSDRDLISRALDKRGWDVPMSVHVADVAKLHVDNGMPVNMGDFMVINGALMMSGDDRAPELLARMRAQIPR